MARWWMRIATAAAVLITPSSGGSAPAAVRVDNLIDEFDLFASRTADLPDAERATRFRARFAGRGGGFYDLRGRDQARYDARIVEALKVWPERRAVVLRVAREFNSATTRGVTRFRRAFPDFDAPPPVYLVHSLGEMDGGTRDYGAGTLLFFGADVIAQIHDADTTGPLFDHEFFHVHHGRYFRDCGKVWCGLWTEGLAVYVTARLNPGAGDAALLLDLPQPIRPAVEPRLREAMCRLSGKLDSTRSEDMAPLFQGQAAAGSPFPPRYGYYLGYMLAQQLGRDRSLAGLARLTPAEVRPLLDRAIAGYGPCATPRR